MTMRSFTSLQSDSSKNWVFSCRAVDQEWASRQQASKLTHGHSDTAVSNSEIVGIKIDGSSD